MKLISELSEDIQYLFEVNKETNTKFLYLDGVYGIADSENRNKRIYPKNIMEPVVESYIKDKITTGTAYGELGHPTGPKLNEERFSHRITNLKWDSNKVVGRAVVLPEGLGKVLMGMVESGGRIGMSTRGLGSVKENSKGINEVQNDFKLVTVDAVTDPSGPGCWVDGIMEGVEWVYDASKKTYMENRIDDLRTNMKKMTLNEINDKKFKLFQYYLENLSKPK